MSEIAVRALVDAADPQLTALLDDTVAELHQRYPDYHPTPTVPGAEYFVATLDGREVGCVALRTMLPTRGEIKRLYVAPDGRRHGVAGRLLDALERRAAERGMHDVVLETGTRQPEAIALYEARGYTPAEPFGEFADSPISRFFGKDLR